MILVLFTTIVGCAASSPGIREKLNSMYGMKKHQIQREMGYPDNQFIDTDGYTIYQYIQSKKAYSPKTYYQNYGMGSVSTYGGGEYTKHCTVTVVIGDYGFKKWYHKGNSCNL
jgi:hypothetical protein